MAYDHWVYGHSLRLSIVEEGSTTRIAEPFVKVPDVIIGTEYIEAKRFLTRTMGSVDDADDTAVSEQWDQTFNGEP